MLPAKLLDVSPKLCSGCRECEIICAISKSGKAGSYRGGIQVIKDEREGIFLPIVCAHCDPAYCMQACPVGALQRNLDNGAVFIDQEICILCRLCIVACPIGAIQVSPEGKLVKCDLCMERKEGPRCVEYCRPRPENSSGWMSNPRMSCLRYVEKERVGEFARLVQVKQSFLTAATSGGKEV